MEDYEIEVYDTRQRDLFHNNLLDVSDEPIKSCLGAASDGRHLLVPFSDPPCERFGPSTPKIEGGGSPVEGHPQGPGEA